MTTTELLSASRAPETIPTGVFGLWSIARPEVPDILRGTRFDPSASRYTILGRRTMATLDEAKHPYGEIVMEDSLQELRRHLPILLQARGRVLVSGLGLGCVVRGLLAKPEVRQIDVVELDSTILRVIGPEFDGNDRVRLYHGDALTIAWPPSSTWDFAWHDVWCEEGSLQVLHAELLGRYRGRARHQGAWQFDRVVKRIWPDRLLNSGRRRRPCSSWPRTKTIEHP